jgi:tetratricopeptide (TPR) repeat protein
VVVAAMAEVNEEIITQDKLIETLNSSGVRLVARELEFAPETLIDWEVLIESEDAYRFAVPLLRRWVIINRPLRRVKEELDRLDPLAETLYQGGQGFYNTNNLDAAEQQLRQALNINPNHLKARLLLGRILLEKGNFTESVSMFDAAYQYDERAARADFIKALLALADTQEENLQLTTYERILKIQSDQPLANEKVRAIWVKRGEAAQALENYEEAIKAFEQIDDSARIEKIRSLMHEKRLTLDMQRAENYERLGQWKSALDTLGELTSEYPESETLRARVETARMNWRTESLKTLEVHEAEENWTRVLEICEALEKDFLGDAEIKAHADRAREQLGIVQKYHEALGALQSGQKDKAREMLSQVLTENPTHLQAAHKLIEATYGKVKITRPWPWGAWMPVGISGLVWMLLGVLLTNGLVLAFLFRTLRRIPIETIILMAIFLSALIGIGVTLYMGRVLEAAFQVDIKGKPSFWHALWVHFPLGLGLFYADHQARRRWLYPIVAMIIPLMITIGPFLYKNAFDTTKEVSPNVLDYYQGAAPVGTVYRASGENETAEGVWSTFLSIVGAVYLFSFVDVMGTCYLRRKIYRGAEKEQMGKISGQAQQVSQFEPMPKAHKNSKMPMAGLPAWAKSPAFFRVVGIFPLLLVVFLNN